MIEDSLRSEQRILRTRFFEGREAIRWRAGRELAAQWLLYLDEPEACWRVATDWLREVLDADRVDGGLGGYVYATGIARDYVVAAESRRAGLSLPSVDGQRFDASDVGIRMVWAQSGLLRVPSVAQYRHFSEPLRATLLQAGTFSKLALPLRDGTKPVGIFCADWQRESPRWNAHVCHELVSFSQDVMGPLMGAMQRMRHAHEVPSRPVSDPDQGRKMNGTMHKALTPSEQKVADLIAEGMSYKEVARALGKSPSTIDHQLRSIREKLGVASTARLVRVLAERGTRH